MDLDFVLRRVTAIPPLRRLWAKCQLGPLAVRLRHDAVERPWYAFGLHQSAALAKKLGLTAISAIEFGVAGGSGLLVMERLAEAIGRELKIRVATFGFDSGVGMPKPVDYRDLPHVWGEGYYPMDLDYYSSTKAAFQIFEGPASSRLPRVYCYFDDICFPDFGCHNEYVGELLAIREFNEEHEKRKICHIAHLNTQRQRAAAWNEQVFVCHDFAHPLYTVNVSPQDLEFRRMPLPR